MSDKEDSPPTRSRSRSRGSERGSRRRTRSRTRSRSRSYFSRSPSRDRYSRSRSRSYSRRRYYKSRSRSRSPRYSRRRRSRYSRSRSRSPRSYYRGRSRSPMSSRRRHKGTRDNPGSSRCVGVFGLSLYTQERDLREVFNRYGSIEEVQVVYDHNTGRSRGFAFIYYRNVEDAVEAKERAPGTEIDGHKIRVDFSITERAHTPTPGIYLGKPTSRGYGSRRESHYSRRSPSPYHHRRSSRYSRSRSRSRSYSPRRY